MSATTFGVATVDITPPVGVVLWGYEPRVSESVGHRLRAEALAYQCGTGGWILVGADVGGFGAPLAERVRIEIAQRTGLPPEAVMLTATHTHSGPHVTDALWRERSEMESAYFRELRSKLVEVAVNAWNARLPGTLVHARTSAPTLGFNRRVQKPDGTWTNVWTDPQGLHTGYFDPTVELVGVRRDDGKLDALLVNYGVHPVCFGVESRAISGDFVSYLKDALETQGKVGTVLFTVSGHGNIDPRDCGQSDCQVTRKMGETLAGIVEQALPALAPVGGAGAAAVHEPWSFKSTWAVEGRLSIYFRHAAKGTTLQTVLAALGAGELVLLGLPGEAVSEHREQFRRISPFPLTILISMANDDIGYLTTDEIMKQGAYEAEVCPLSPMEAVLTERVTSVLKQAREAINSSTK